MFPFEGIKDTFTCITCRVAFKDGEIQRLHYKSDWHRYNLKRKVADLPPVTSEEFQRRVLNQRHIDEQQQEDKAVYCKPCRKSFSNQNAFDNHLNSRKHKENEKCLVFTSEPSSILSSTTEESKEIEDVEEVDSDEWEDDLENPIDNNDCLFCQQHSRNFFKNLEHMTTLHSFFIPDIEYCNNVKGLLCYLGEKVSDGFMCLWCNDKGRTFHTAEAAKSHMVDKGHCRMLHEGSALAEYADFYDYSPSYPDAKDEENIDEEMDTADLDGTDYQLKLPSGVTIGHRSLMRYYKQSVVRSVVPVQSHKKLHKVLATYRALGWTSTQQEEAARKARDIHYLKRIQSKLSMKLGTKANKFQPHFRQQVNY